MEDTEQTISWLHVIMTLGGSLFTFLGVYVVNVLKTNKEANRDIKIAEINSTSDEYESLKKEFHKALESIKDLKDELDKEKEIKANIQKKFEAVKLAFRIIFNQYAKQFKDDPEQLSMLEELKDIIEN